MNYLYKISVGFILAFLVLGTLYAVFTTPAFQESWENVVEWSFQNVPDYSLEESVNYNNPALDTIPDYSPSLDWDNITQYAEGDVTIITKKSKATKAQDRDYYVGVFTREVCKSFGPTMTLRNPKISKNDGRQDRFVRICQYIDEDNNIVRNFVQVLRRLENKLYMEIDAYEASGSFADVINRAISEGYTTFHGPLP